MHFHRSHPLQPFWNLTAAPIQAEALEQAIERRLFDLLEQPASAATLARQLQCQANATVVWLDLLWSLELLQRHVPADAPDTPLYVRSPMATRFFVEGAADNCAQAWLYRKRFLARFAGQWGTLLRDGFNPHGMAAPRGSWAQAAREQIGQEQLAVSVPAVLRVLESLPPLPDHGRLLDLGGGPGHVGIALARRLPGWHGVVCDQPETAEVADANIRQAGLSERLQALGRDLDSEAIGEDRYDLIWCSSLLHFLRDPRDAVGKMFDALVPGGLLLLAHAELSTEPQQAARVLPFYGTLKLRGNYLPGQGEIVRMMAEAGFADIRSLGASDFPLAPVWLHMGRKA